MTDCMSVFRLADALKDDPKEDTFRKELAVKAMQEVNDLMDSKTQLARKYENALAAKDAEKKAFSDECTVQMNQLISDTKDLGAQLNDKENKIEELMVAKKTALKEINDEHEKALSTQKESLEAKLTRTVNIAKHEAMAQITSLRKEKDEALISLQTKHAEELCKLNDGIREKGEEIQRIREEAKTANEKAADKDREMESTRLMMNAQKVTHAEEKTKWTADTEEFKKKAKKENDSLKRKALDDAEISGLKRTENEFKRLCPLLIQFGSVFGMMTDFVETSKKTIPTVWSSSEGYTFNLQPEAP